MIVFNDAYLGGKIAEASTVNFNPTTDPSIVRVSDDGERRLLGGSVFQNYTGREGSMGIHVASFEPLWINPDLLWATFHYPFVQLGVRRLFGQVATKNQAALRFDLKLGFKILTVVERVYPDDDMILVAMDREDCRHLKIKPRTLMVEEAA